LARRRFCIFISETIGRARLGRVRRLGVHARRRQLNNRVGAGATNAEEPTPGGATGSSDFRPFRERRDGMTRRADCVLSGTASNNDTNRNDQLWSTTPDHQTRRSWNHLHSDGKRTSVFSVRPRPIRNTPRPEPVPRRRFTLFRVVVSHSVCDLSVYARVSPEQRSPHHPRRHVQLDRWPGEITVPWKTFGKP